MKFDEIEMPVLRAILDAEEQSEAGDADYAEVVRGSGLEQQEVSQALRRLEDAGYVEGHLTDTAQGVRIWHFVKLRERGLRAVHRWPAEPADELIAALIQALEGVAEDEDLDDDSRSRVRSFLDWLSGAGGNAAGSLAANLAAQGIIQNL